MRYVAQVLNRRTGDLDTIEIGDWITITEFGKLVGEGPREIRQALVEMEFLQPETASRSNHTRMRLCPWVVQKGWGKRIEKKGTNPFDTISPEAQDWIKERLPDVRGAMQGRKHGLALQAEKDLAAFVAWRAAEGVTREEDFSTRRRFSWLADHYPDLTQDDVSLILAVSPPLVSRMAKERASQLDAARRSRKRELPKTSRQLSLVDALIASLKEEQPDQDVSLLDLLGASYASGGLPGRPCPPAPL